jgi:hypothetical protein
MERNAFMTGEQVGFTVERLRTAATAKDLPYRSAGPMQQPETVTAKPAHVRVDRRQGRRHRHTRLDGITAFGQDSCSGLSRFGMGGNCHATATRFTIQGHVALPEMPA